MERSSAAVHAPPDHVHYVHPAAEAGAAAEVYCCRMSPSTSLLENSEATKATLWDRSPAVRSAPRRLRRSSIMHVKNSADRCRWLIFYARPEIADFTPRTMRRASPCLPLTAAAPPSASGARTCKDECRLCTHKSDSSRIISR